MHKTDYIYNETIASVSLKQLCQWCMAIALTSVVNTVYYIVFRILGLFSSSDVQQD